MQSPPPQGDPRGPRTNLVRGGTAPGCRDGPEQEGQCAPPIPPQLRAWDLAAIRRDEGWTVGLEVSHL